MVKTNELGDEGTPMATQRSTAETSRAARLRYWAGGLVLLALIGTGASALAAGPGQGGNTGVAPTAAGDSTGPSASPSTGPSVSPSTSPSTTASVSPTPSASTTSAAPSVSPTVEPTPVITYRLERKRTTIAFGTRNIKTAALNKGVTRVKQRGHRGLRVSVYRLTFKDGVQSRRRLVRRYVARRPVPRIVLHGTYVKPKPQPQPKPQPGNKCDPNYAGACVPIASDVDCAGGSGNGPAYVQGPVRVVGNDIYGLDADGDGWGCE